MALAELTSSTAVERALDEFDLMGREAFLTNYGFGRARRYFVRRDGKYYDSKDCRRGVRVPAPGQGVACERGFLWWRARRQGATGGIGLRCGGAPRARCSGRAVAAGCSRGGVGSA